MPAGPLDDTRLKAVEDSLNAGRFDDAQKRLATLASIQGLGPGLAYLSARLLFHRGRLDAETVAARLRDVLHERPDFAEAKTWLETVERSRALTQPPPPNFTFDRSSRPTEPPPPILETPRIPGFDFDEKTWANLGTLELPKSEKPTEPAPPPESANTPTPVAAVEPISGHAGPWDALEKALSTGNREAVVSGLDKLAARDLDALLSQKKPKFTELAGEVARFLARAPITRFFAPFDLSLDSVARLDEILKLFVPPAITTGHYALRVSLSVYLGECVREAPGGAWEGTLAEPEHAAVVRDSERYVPWTEVARAFGEGVALRQGAGSPPHPAAEPPEELVSVIAETPTPWDPK